jgi:hypothetical protein
MSSPLLDARARVACFGIGMDEEIMVTVIVEVGAETVQSIHARY